MSVKNISINYFKGFSEVSNFRTNSTTANVSALIKVASYFTIVIPLIFAAIYAVASCLDRSSTKKASEPVPQLPNIGNSIDNEGLAPPKIVGSHWGSFKIEQGGETKTFKDVVIMPSTDPKKTAVEWRWQWCGKPGVTNNHKPGRDLWIHEIMQTLADNESSARIPKRLILSTGRGMGGLTTDLASDKHGVLEVPDSVVEYWEGQGMTVHKLNTIESVKLYDSLTEEEKQNTMAFLHSTC